MASNNGSGKNGKQKPSVNGRASSLPGSKIDAKKKAAFVEAIRNGKRRGLAALEIGVSRSAIWKHLKADQEFRKEVSQAEMDANEKVENALFRAAAVEGNVTAIQVWLYNRSPDRWRDMRTVEHTGKIHGEVIVKTLGQGVAMEDI